MKKLLFFLAILSCLKSNAQYRIEIAMPAPKDSVYYLYHWYQSEKLYLIKDTAKVKAANKIIFTGEKNLPEGMYFLVSRKVRLFDFPVVGQNFKVTTDSSDFVGKMTIEGNIEASTYANFTKENIRLQRAFQKASNETDKKTIYQQYQSLTKTYISSNPNTFTANFLKANIPVKTEAIKPNATRQDTLAYIKN